MWYMSLQESAGAMQKSTKEDYRAAAPTNQNFKKYGFLDIKTTVSRDSPFSRSATEIG
jgi:hypothetical protein